MTIFRVNAPQPLLRLREGMDQLFNDVFDNRSSRAASGSCGRHGAPALNVWEDDQNLYAEAEIPGQSMEDIELYVVGNELTLKGGRRNVEQEGVTYHRHERGVGPFSRVLRLPVEIDADKVTASLRDGVLNITLPKSQAVLPRRIEVKS